MVKGVSLEGPKVAADVFEATRLGGAIGKGHKTMGKAATGLFERKDGHFVDDKLEIGAKPGDSRWKIFKRTFVGFADGGARTGALLGGIVMSPVDLAVGNGTQRKDGEKSSVLDKGIAGAVVEGAAMVVSGIAEAGGNIAGGTVATVALPASLGTDKSALEWIEDGASGAGKALGGTVAVGVAGPAGIALTAARLPSLIVKGTLAGVIGFVSAVVAVPVATVRAIIKK